MNKNIKAEKRMRLKGKIRANIFGTGELPRLSVFRSNKFIYGQLIDDNKGVTIAAVSDIKSKGKGTKVASAKAMGVAIAKDATAKGITKVVFDRNGFKYTGRVKEFADGAREGGLTF